MRILFLVHNFPPEFNGGTERVVESLAVRFVARGHKVAVLSGSEHAAPSARVEDEPPTDPGRPHVYRLRRGPAFHNVVDPFRAELVPLIEDVYARFQPDLVHVYHTWNLGGDLVQRAARRGVPAVLSLDDHHATCALFFRMPDGVTFCELPQTAATCGPCAAARYAAEVSMTAAHVVFRAADVAAEVRAAAAVIVPSASHRASLAPRLPAGLRIDVVPPGVPFGSPAPRVPRTGPLRVLHFGNLCRLKGVEVLAQAVRRADPEGTRLRTVLAGRVIETDLDTAGTACPGAYDQASLALLAADADVAVFPSLARETYSFTVDEALRFGLPVLVSDGGAPRERVGTRGRVLPAGDVNAWAAALRDLADNPAALASLHAGAHGALSTPDDHADAVLALYARIAATWRAPVIDLDARLLQRVGAYESRLDEIMHFVARIAAGGEKP